ncbi:MAG: RIP metalloprotease RseP [Alicyclobacillaceae bacterium]|jgi:regulator of sigma E protease|uniref:RIP metalloprotease RseP n=1 Tax=Alicyclobacillus sp. SP_1 TaxID=2942475 RepID=UPI002157753D|nr:RIP metalloprotease RseP [Alicyclobacillus sp. SP_1]MCY0887240.1 RIP metalloprotease RseP [Alicyclobacillaceae bacterium]MCY0896906.1 RIP metalloprotease RseP [Alicyclobacillaceae bacterium]
MWLISLLHILRSAIAIILVFVVCIVLHEFGHFYVAKKSGVAVPVFALGMGPKLFAFQRGGTEYSIRLFPIGGFVQLAGEMPQDAYFRIGESVAYRLNDHGQISVLAEPDTIPDAPVGVVRALDLMQKLTVTLETADGTLRTFPVQPHARVMTGPRSSIPIVEKREQLIGKPLSQRAAIILAGPVMNFLLAGVLFSLAFIHFGMPSGQPVVGGVISGTPAAAAHLETGDRIVQAGQRPIDSWGQLVQAIHSDNTNPPRPVKLVVMHGSQRKVVEVKPELGPNGVPLLGIDSALTHNPAKAFVHGFASVYTNSVSAIHLYGQVIERHQFRDLSGPVGIADVISQQAQTGIWQVVYITALLSLNLGLFNLIPIPALDGGRLLFMVIELIRGKAVDPRKEGLVHLVGFGLLMVLTVVITYRDVVRFF